MPLIIGGGEFPVFVKASDIFLGNKISKLLKKARKNVIYFGLVTYLFILRSIPINA